MASKSTRFRKSKRETGSKFRVKALAGVVEDRPFRRAGAARDRRWAMRAKRGLPQVLGGRSRIGGGAAYV